MIGAALKLSVSFGESLTHGPDLASDALMARLTERGLACSVLLRGIEGYGLNRRLAAARFPDLSTDLPLLAVAVGAREDVLAALQDVDAVVARGLVTLEATHLATGGDLAGAELAGRRRGPADAVLPRRPGRSGPPRGRGRAAPARREHRRGPPRRGRRDRRAPRAPRAPCATRCGRWPSCWPSPSQRPRPSRSSSTRAGSSRRWRSRGGPARRASRTSGRRSTCRRGAPRTRAASRCTTR